MNTEAKTSNGEKTLRIVSPKLYNHIITLLAEHHIHPYDITANVIEETSGLQLIIRFGEDFAHAKSESFSFKQIENPDDSITAFIDSIGEEAKEAMVADYFKMMKM